MGNPPDPRKFQPMNTGPQLPTTTPTALPVGSPFSFAQQSQLQAALSAAGIWGTIQNLGGDIWGTIAKVLPKDANGNIDWGKLGGDIVGWVKNNKDTILSGLNVYNQYQRSQKSDEYAQKAVDLKQKSFDAKEPLRLAGQAGMLNPQANTPDISNLRAMANRAPTQMALPVGLNTQNAQNAQRIAGPQSGNPFSTALPVAPPSTPANGPMPSPSGSGAGPARPGFTPQPRPVPRPVAIPGATAQPLPLSPEDMMPRPPLSGIGRRIAPLPIGDY